MYILAQYKQLYQFLPLILVKSTGVNFFVLRWPAYRTLWQGVNDLVNTRAITIRLYTSEHYYTYQYHVMVKYDPPRVRVWVVKYAYHIPKAPEIGL